MKMKYLNNDPQSIETVVGMQSRSVLMSKLGSPDGLPSVADDLNSLITSLQANAAKVVALASDETRTPVSAHGAAKALAEQSSKSVRQMAVKLAQKGEDLQLAGADAAAEAFAPRPGYGHLDAEIRGYLREAVKSPSGLSEVAEMAKKDAAIAGIIYHSPHYLIGVPKSIHEKWQANAVINHMPKAAKMVEEGSSLIQLAKKYEGFVAEIHRSFYSPALAEKTSTRVEV